MASCICSEEGGSWIERSGVNSGVDTIVITFRFLRPCKNLSSLVAAAVLQTREPVEISLVREPLSRGMEIGERDVTFAGHFKVF